MVNYTFKKEMIMPYFIGIHLDGNIISHYGNSVSDALGTPVGLDYYLEAKHKLVCDTVKVGSKNLDVTVTYATDTCTSPYSYIIADVKPFCNKYNSIIDKRFNTTDELVEAVKQLT